MAFTRPDNDKSIWRIKPNALHGTATTVKADFDKLLNENTDDLITVIGELEAATGAASIGAKSTANEDTTVQAALGGKVDKVTGKSLLLDTEITRLAGLTGIEGLDADSVDDTSTTNKFVTAADLIKLSNLSGTNTGDQDISVKADKVVSPTSGNFAALDVNGNLTDSGHKDSDYADASHSHTVSDITDFPSIPNELSDLSEDATHRTVTDTEKSTWNGKQDALGFTAANDSDVVHDTGDETVAGVKTFSSFPITPSSAPTTNYQAANKKYVDDSVSSAGGGDMLKSVYDTNGDNKVNSADTADTVTGLSVTTGKTLTASNTLTLTATDGSTLAVGAGGTLGTAAYTAATAYAPASHVTDLVTGESGVHGFATESGTFLLTIYGSTAAGTQTYSSQAGTYEKVGNIVHVTGKATLASTSGATGYIYLGGLPFTRKSTVGGRNDVRISFLTDVTGTTLANALGGYIPTSGAFVDVSQDGISASNLTATASIHIEATYEI